MCGLAWGRPQKDQNGEETGARSRGPCVIFFVVYAFVTHLWRLNDYICFSVTVSPEKAFSWQHQACRAGFQFLLDRENGIINNKLEIGEGDLVEVADLEMNLEELVEGERHSGSQRISRSAAVMRGSG